MGRQEFAGVPFSDQEWSLLVGLPQSVATAASAAEADGDRRTVAESAAGQEAIAAGRQYGSPLVEAVAEELTKRIGDPDEGVEPPVISPPDREATIEDTLERVRAAVTLLEARVDEGAAGAYRHWLVGIAQQVVTAASSGGVLGIGGETVSQSEQRFVDELRRLLDD